MARRASPRPAVAAPRRNMVLPGLFHFSAPTESRASRDARRRRIVMVKGIVKAVGGVVGVGIAVFAAIAAAGLAGDGLEEAFGTPEKSGDTESLRKAS